MEPAMPGRNIAALFVSAASGAGQAAKFRTGMAQRADV
jgi:hypothetical protein